MNLETFTKLINDLEKINKRTGAAYNLGIDLIEYGELYSRVIAPLTKAAFNDPDDWIGWYCYEKDFGKRKDMTAQDKDGNEICRNIAELYELVGGG